MQATITQFADRQRIDERAGIIFGMSIITTGEARGHGLMIDSITLDSVLKAALACPNGVPCKANHGSGVLDTLGVIRNPRIDGNKVRGDLHLFKSHPRTATVLEVARKAPESMGLSISFNYTTETINKMEFVRVSRLYTIDLVSDPASNSGMFSAPPSTSSTTGDRETLAAAFLTAFGQAEFDAIVRNHGSHRAHDVFERTMFHSGLSIPGYTYSASAARHGQPIPLHGMRRVEMAARQARIDATFTA